MCSFFFLGPLGLISFSDVPKQGSNCLRTHGPLGLISLGPVLVEHTQLGQQICVVPSCRVRERVDMHDSRQEAMRQMTECSQKTQNGIISHPVAHIQATCYLFIFHTTEHLMLNLQSLLLRLILPH